jgi:glutamine amidotransferase
MTTAVVHYNAGNIQSLCYALERLGQTPLLTKDPEVLMGADKVIFPGVGEASSTMKYLQDIGLDKVIPSLRQPVLGICLGMQLMCQHSEENNTTGLGIFEVPVLKFPSTKNFKVPHMGWNTLNENKDWTEFVPDESYAYFVHSYYVPVNPQTTIVTNHGIDFSAAMRKDNFYAVQFHPEKSAQTGTSILERFLKI